jgi:hypothetical protein
MTTRYFRVKAIMAKIEVTYGVDPVPTGAANAIQCKTDARFTPIQSEKVPREVIQAYMGHQQDLPVGTSCMLEIDVEAAGAGGAVDVPPAWGPLMRMCGFAQTVGAAVSVVYAPISTAFESGTVYFNRDGVLNKMLGCRGSLSVKFTPRGIPYLTFKLSGLYGGKSDTAITAQTITGWKVPFTVTKTNTPTVLLHAYASILYDFSLDMSNQIVYRNQPGREDVLITDRAPTGSIEIEDTLVAEKNWEAINQAVTLGALQIVHGVGVGNVVQFDAPAVEIGDPTPTNRDGVIATQLPLRFTPTSAGNNEFTITTK